MVNIVVLTGAGISAESGLQTFRASDGLWCDHRVEDVATPEAFERNPVLVHEFYNLRRRQLAEVQPNAAHHALAELAVRWDGDFLLVTQNVDNLHDRAMDAVRQDGRVDDRSLIHMHGELAKVRCVHSGQVIDWEGDLSLETVSPLDESVGTLRPHIVWFGEMPLEMERIYNALQQCDLFVSIGTSGNVYPAAGFVQEAKAAGAEAVEINLEPTGNPLFDKGFYGNATEQVSVFIKELGY